MSCRILYLIGHLHTGGQERQLYYLLRAMDRERYKPAVAIWRHSEGDVHVPQIKALGVPLYSFSKEASGVEKLQALRQLVRQLRPEVVHSYSFYTNFAAQWATFRTEALASGSIRSDFSWAKKQEGPLLGRLSGRWPRDQICNSVSAAEAAQQSRGPFVPKRLNVVRNGLDLNRFHSVPLAAKASLNVLGVGYLLPVKRWDLALFAAQELRNRGLDCRMRIAGDGPLAKALEHQARGLGIADRLELMGHVDDIPGLLADSAFLVHTAESEGCPNAVMEAMACGRAVVATEAGDVPRLVEDGKTGYVVRRGNSAELAERMAELITDRNLCRRMGEAGRSKAEREFNLDRLVEETLDAYRAAGWKDY
jgi:glycosyltransferase involved in cell wall biosynthesis